MTPRPAPARDDDAEAILSGRTALGIELGSTRIKASLIGPAHTPLAAGSHAWNNTLVDGLWTYDLDDVVSGLQSCYATLVSDVQQRYGTDLATVGSLGVSAMMHGYLAFDDQGQLLVPFRTWRNTNTDAASRHLSEVFDQNIPHRWSVAHLYQAMLDQEEHLSRLARLTTLAGYVHERLTGQHVVGVGDASGMFPIDVATGGYDKELLARFDELAAPRGYPWRLADVLPAVLPAGAPAGRLSLERSLLLDPTATLRPGIALCPPEGDAGTGMVATNSVTPGTGNVSAGTSIFAMVVLEHGLSRSHPEIDLVTTPSGDLVGMVHCNNGTSEIDAWVAVFGELADALGARPSTDRLFELIYTIGMAGEPDAGGLLAYNFVSGEPVAGIDEGRPLLVRRPDSRLTLANLVRAQLNATIGSLRMGMDVLAEEGVRPHLLFAHGGFFTTKDVGQRILAAALDTPIAVGDTAGEGGAWGMALLAAYATERTDTLSLQQFLAETVFDDDSFEVVSADAGAIAGFSDYMATYRRGLSLQREAATLLA
jgi:sugar (pentulose or hexulose) kinase